MQNRRKNIIILTILITFLLILSIIPATCLFKKVTGIYCPACGMTRAFYSIIYNFDLIQAFSYNILSIPLFIFIVSSSFILIYEIITNKFNYIPKLLQLLSNKLVLAFIFIFVIISFIVNNIYLK